MKPNTARILDDARTNVLFAGGNLKAANETASITESIIILDLITTAAELERKLAALITAIESDRKE
jgi:hypothetical protein